MQIAAIRSTNLKARQKIICRLTSAKDSGGRAKDFVPKKKSVIKGTLLSRTRQLLLSRSAFAPAATQALSRDAEGCLLGLYFLHPGQRKCIETPV